MLSTIGDLGEFGLIARVTAKFPPTEEVILGPGDDAAIVRCADQRIVASTDVLVEGRHFRRAWSSPADVGHKAAAQNLADIVAMGARPTALLVGLAAPRDLPVDWVDGLAEGIAAECAATGAAVVGGDTVSSDTLTIAITALGDLAGNRAVRRDGARPGDVVAVTGRLGLSAAGLALLELGREEPAACVAEHRRPHPPYEEGPRAALHGATAMLDVSDGLVQDLGHICRASGVRVDLDRSALVPAPELREAAELIAAVGESRARSAVEFLLAGGEDHALAATYPPDAPLPTGWTRIGVVTPAASHPEDDPVTVDGQPPPVGSWDHFGGAR